MLSEVFWISFVATASATMIKLASMCYKSKCRECSVCGGRIKIIRDIQAETDEREFELTHPPPPKSPSQKDLGTEA
jgi:hypothetical protein